MGDSEEAYESLIEVTDLQDFVATDEKRISVDPISLRADSTTNNVVVTKPKLYSYSLPNSASSSPKKVLNLNILRKNPKNLTQASSLPIHASYRQHSIALTNLERLREIRLSRSKSCGEGRASRPSEDLTFWSQKNIELSQHGSNKESIISSSSGTEVELDYKDKIRAETNDDDREEDDSKKCGALCLFLPGFGKAKQMRTKMHQHQQADEIMNFKESETTGHVVSKRFSMEKFECASWRSSAILDEKEEDGSNNLYYDLPLEMIRFSVSDTHSTVTSAFVFDNKEPTKGVLKKSSSRETLLLKTSPDGSRRVRFSTSSTESCPASPPNTVTPKILKAREEFKAFLEAQIS